jgi:hypothetical protein
MAAVLFPDLPRNQPLAIGFVYDQNEQIDPVLLLQTLTDAVARCAEGQIAAPTSVQPLFEANGLQPAASRLPARMPAPQVMSARLAALPGERPHQ